MTKVTTHRYKLSKCSTQTHFPEASSKIPVLTPIGLASLSVCSHLNQPLEPRGYRITLVRPGSNDHTECQGWTSQNPLPTCTLTYRQRVGQTRFCVEIPNCQKSTSVFTHIQGDAEECDSLDFQVKGSNKLLHNQTKTRLSTMIAE